MTDWNKIGPELLEHVKDQYAVLMWTLALLIKATQDTPEPFYPSKTDAWPVLEKTPELVARAEGRR